MTERLDRLLASQGLMTRREAQERIRRGAVTADGVPVRHPETKLDPEAVRLAVDGEPVRWQRYVYIMMNKAAGTLCATKDPKIETVVSALPEAYRRRGVFPAGRLDRDAEGLLLLTDDGDAAHMLLSPARHVEKTYYVRYAGTLDADAEERFAAGIGIGGGEVCLPAALERLGTGEARVRVCEGRFHQVKRMVAAAGGEVTYLRRERFGPLTLDAALAPGAWRELERDEILEIEAIKQKNRAECGK